ncbi:MAG: tetratricopeptide repeat protein [Armatimonadota bacterium]|nr:tetratricopeptide repeat protein [Armatimonadota bacterium]
MKPSTLQLAEEYLRRGELKQAGRLLQRAVRAGKASVECYLRLAEVYRLQENWQAAIDAVRAALQLQPNSTTLRERLVELLLESGRLSEAVEECQRWLREAPDHPVALEHLLDAYWQSMDYEHALQVANQLVRLQPRSPHYRLRRARLLDNLGRHAQAVSDYETLAFDRSAPDEIITWAISELERLDRTQIELMLQLLSEDGLFRLEFLRNPLRAARQRGFVFSRVGEQVVEALVDTVRTNLQRPRCYVSYH